MRSHATQTPTNHATKFVDKICETLAPIHLTPHEEYTLFYSRANSPNPQIDWAIMVQYAPLHRWVQNKVHNRLRNMNMGDTIKDEDISNSIWIEIFDQARLFDPTKNIKYITYISRGLVESILRQLLQQHFFIRIKHPKIRHIIQLFNSITLENEQEIQQARKDIVQHVLGRNPNDKEQRWLNLLQAANRPNSLMDISPAKPPIYTYRRYNPEHEHTDETIRLEQREQQHHQNNIMRHIHDILHTGITQKKFSKRNAQIYKGIMFCEVDTQTCARKHHITRQRAHQIIQNMNNIIRQELNERGIKFLAG